jgi:hypothetical protein
MPDFLANDGLASEAALQEAEKNREAILTLGHQSHVNVYCKHLH